jgi:moderate conductance mechanosensitive channel
MKFKNRPKQEKVRIITVTVIIFLCLFFGMFAPIIFPDTMFAQIIDHSVGKFFNVWRFFENNYVTILESLTIVIFVWIVNRLLCLLIALMTKKGHRSETIGNLITSSIKYFSVILAIFLILSAWGVQDATLLAGAGILGLALSFGSQSLIEDVIAGLFIIFEKQFSVGDFVKINDVYGNVKDVGIRITRIEDSNGDILIINNSDIRGAINMSNSLSTAICDLSISYDQDIETIESLIKGHLDQVRKNIPSIIEGPYYYGIQKLGESAVVLRLVAKTEEMTRFEVVRALNREFKVLFDQNGIEIPFPQVVVHHPKENKMVKKT